LVLGDVSGGVATRQSTEVAVRYQLSRVSQRREPVVCRGLAVSVLAGPPKNRQRLLDEIRRRIS
jgi:hypothetical protein